MSRSQTLERAGRGDQAGRARSATLRSLHELRVVVGSLVTLGAVMTATGAEWLASRSRTATPADD